MKNDLIEVASFPTPNDTDVLESLFQKEGIDYFIENANSATLIPGVDVRLLVRESDVEKSIELIRHAGFETFLSDLEEEDEI